MIEYRNMQPGDMQGVYDFWKEVFPHNPISVGSINYLLLCNDELDFSFYWLACEDGKIAGAACGAMDYESKIAYIQFIGVRKESRRIGIAAALMKRLITKFSECGAKEVFFSGYPRNYVTPGLDTEKYPLGHSFFIKSGFTVSSSPVSMQILLKTYEAPELNLSKDFQIVPFADRHLAPVLCLCKEHLQSEWVKTIRTGYIKGGYSCNGFVCIGKNGEVIGFAFYGMVGDDIKRFGPTGVNPAYRGHYIGKALLHSCLKALKRAGHEKCYFLWGDEGSVAKKMYENNGFSVFSNMVILRKSIGENNG